jgi:hypothetical protein
MFMPGLSGGSRESYFSADSDFFRQAKPIRSFRSAGRSIFGQQISASGVQARMFGLQ